MFQKPLSKNNITVVYKGSSITLDEIMYLNEKRENKNKAQNNGRLQ